MADLVRSTDSDRGIDFEGSFRRPSQLSLEVASYVRELVLSGQLSAPQTIGIDRLARDLGVSATPVREALLALHSEGFLEFAPRRGFKVSPLSKPDIADLYWAQGELAAELARRAARIAGQTLVEPLELIQAQMRRVVDLGDKDRIEALNHDFHRTVNLAADSPKLLWLLRSTLRYTPRRFFASIPGWVEASLGDHDAVIAAFRDGASDSAAEAMRGHIRHAGTLLVANLKPKGVG